MVNASDTRAIRDAAQDVFNALSNLNAEWNRRDHTGDVWSTDYPFDSSLEDVLANVALWIEGLTQGCEFTSADECNMARERAVAGTDREPGGCAVHGEYRA